DSPMATSATYLYYRHPDYHKAPSIASDFARQLETNMLVFVKSGTHSKQLNELKSNAIIISSSGMMTGGRILHHMFHRLRNENDTFLIAGYQAAGTRGRSLLEKQPTIKIFGESVPVKCKVEEISAMSGHAAKEELLRWLGGFRSKPNMTLAVHGEDPDISVYAKTIHDRLGMNVIVPQYMDSFSLFEGI